MTELTQEQRDRLFPQGQPHAIVNFKTGDLKMAFVVESPEEVAEIVNGCEERVCKLTGWTATNTFEIWTRPDNVAQFRPNE